jgi:hypothetical protein
MRRIRSFKSILALAAGLALLALLVAGCGPKRQQETPDLSTLIQSAVQATVAALPQATQMPLPTTEPPPSLTGLFCEYEFCIGHPNDVPLFDARRDNNPAEISTYASGRVAGFRPDLFIITGWVGSAGSWDPAGMMKVLQDEFVVSATGDYKVDLVQGLNAAYQPVSAPPNSVFGGGLSAAWRCGDRDFIWMVFTGTADQATGLLNDALAKFRCNTP